MLRTAQLRSFPPPQTGAILWPYFWDPHFNQILPPIIDGRFLALRALVLRLAFLALLALSVLAVLFGTRHDTMR